MLEVCLAKLTPTVGAWCVWMWTCVRRQSWLSLSQPVEPGLQLGICEEYVCMYDSTVHKYVHAHDVTLIWCIPYLPYHEPVPDWTLHWGQENNTLSWQLQNGKR